jgi:uncharacterized membrane protein YeiH
MSWNDLFPCWSTHGMNMHSKSNSARLLLVVDLLGTFLFALEGSMAAIQGNLDLLGLMVLAFATALGGGIMRDVLIGALPPSSIRDWRYSATAFLAAAYVFLWHSGVSHIPTSLMVTLDAAGLGLFAVAGAQKALDHGIPPLIAILMGGITGVGGGTICDMLLARVPVVLRSDVYATAALLGAMIVVVGLKLKVRPVLAMTVGAVACFVLRMVAVWQHWNLPRVTGH